MRAYGIYKTALIFCLELKQNNSYLCCRCWFSDLSLVSSLLDLPSLLSLQWFTFYLKRSYVFYGLHNDHRSIKFRPCLPVSLMPNLCRQNILIIKISFCISASFTIFCRYLFVFWYLDNYISKYQQSNIYLFRLLLSMKHMVF